MQKRLVNLSDHDIKNLQKETIDTMLYDLKAFLSLGMTVDEKAQLIELTDLQIGLRYLKS